MDEKNLGIVFGSILLGAEQLQISLAMKQKLQDQVHSACSLLSIAFYMPFYSWN